MVKIIAEFVPAINHNNKVKKKTYLMNILDEDSETDSDELEEDERKFQNQYGKQKVFQADAMQDKLVICVQDTGIGIKRKEKYKLF